MKIVLVLVPSPDCWRERLLGTSTKTGFKGLKSLHQVLCGNSTFFNNQSPTESDNEELHKLLKLLSFKAANETAECH